MRRFSISLKLINRYANAYVSNEWPRVASKPARKVPPVQSGVFYRWPLQEGTTISKNEQKRKRRARCGTVPPSWQGTREQATSRIST